ncbi:unnamed protein product [Urochloa humidicola]
MDSNSQQPPAPPAATMDSNSVLVLQGSSSQQTAAVPALAAATGGPTAQPPTAVPRSPTAIGVLALRPVHQQQPRPNKLPVFRPPAPVAAVTELQILQGSSSQTVAAMAAYQASMLGVGRPLAPAMAVTLANPSPRLQLDRLMLRDLQGSKLPVFRGPPPRPELMAGSGSGNALLQSSSLNTGLCTLNKQAGPPSPDSSSEWDSGSEDEVEILDSGSDSENTISCEM